MSADDPVLLAAKGHIYTQKNTYVTDMETKQSVVIIYPPIHSTYKMQQLYVGFMASFQTY